MGHMVWWLYGAQNVHAREQLPLILWLQGGPGGSGTGFGNFGEIGPLDMNMKTRHTSWTLKANLLFIDNPVGAGFSYVEDDNLFTTNVTQIAEDLFTIFSNILEQLPVFKTTPFYIFCESYGGKMTAAFGDRLLQGMKHKQIEVNFKGVALGDSWISPVDSTLSWGPYLYQFNLLDEMDLNRVNRAAMSAAKAVEEGDYEKSTRMWALTEDIIDNVTDHVNVYNVLQHNGASPFYSRRRSDVNYMTNLFLRHTAVYQPQSLADLMNGPIREKLKVIPDTVKWGAQADQVFMKQSEDFMKPVIDTVSRLLAHGLKVVVFQGQLDMICDSPAAETWIKKLYWPHLGSFLASPRKALYVGGDRNTQGFVKTYDNFSLYYIMKAGHMVPLDNGPMALEMVHRILSGQ